MGFRGDSLIGLVVVGGGWCWLGVSVTVIEMKRFSYANVMSTMAFFLALGGVSYAAVSIPANSVGTRQIVDKSVGTNDLADRAVTSSKINPAVLTLFKGQKGDVGTAGVSGVKGDPGERGPAGANGVGSVRITYVEQDDPLTSGRACNAGGAISIDRGCVYSWPPRPYLPYEWTEAPEPVTVTVPEGAISLEMRTSWDGVDTCKPENGYRDAQAALRSDSPVFGTYGTDASWQDPRRNDAFDGQSKYEWKRLASFPDSGVYSFHWIQRVYMILPNSGFTCFEAPPTMTTTKRRVWFKVEVPTG